MNTPTTDAADLRAKLNRSGAGVLWCRTDNYGPLDDLLTRIDRTEHPHIRRVTVTASKRDRPATVATDVAGALGVVAGATGQGRGEVQMPQLVPLLLEHPVQHLLIGSAWWTHIDSLAELTIATRAAGVSLWLLGTDPLTPREAATLSGLGHHIDDTAVLDAFDDLAGTPTHSVPLDATDPWAHVTSVPTSDFVTFLADVHDQLPTDQAALVEDTLRRERAAAAYWFTQNPAPTKGDVALELQRRWNSCVSWTQFLTIIRGWQIAALHTGHLLKVSPAQLAGTAQAVPSARQRDATQWERLRAWHEPSKAAACALVAAELGSEDAIEVTLGMVSADGATVTSNGRTVTIDEAARKYIRAAVHSRRLSGAGPDDILLLTPTGARPAARWVGLQALTARQTFGLPLTSATITGRTTGGDRWATRWGLTLIELT